MKIAFDIDGTLTDHKWLHRELRKYAEDGHDVIVWSGGGQDYANRYVQANDLPARTAIKCSERVDVAFDDATEYIAGATITVQVPYN